MIRSIRWRRLDCPGWERAELRALETGYDLTGHAEFTQDEEPASLDYSILIDASWRSIRANVRGHYGRKLVDMELATTKPGAWYDRGGAIAQVSGCIDLDLSFSPATNLLAIRRLALPVGSSAEVRSAWL